MKKLLLVLLTCLLFVSCEESREMAIKHRVVGTTSTSASSDKTANDVGMIAMFATGSIIPALAASTDIGKQAIGKVQDVLSTDSEDMIIARFELIDESVNPGPYAIADYKVSREWYESHLGQEVFVYRYVWVDDKKNTIKLRGSTINGIREVTD